MGFSTTHEVTLGDGAIYILHYDLKAFCAFEESSGEAIADLGDSIKLTVIAHLLAAGLRKHHPEAANYRAVIEGVPLGRGSKKRGPSLLNMQNMSSVVEVVMEAVMAAMPQEDDADEAPEAVEEGND